MSNNYNLKATQGTTFYFKFTILTAGSPWNLTGYTARMQVRPTVEATKVLLNLNTENGTMSINASLGEVSISVPATTMAGVISGKHVYDIELVSGGGEVTKPLKGKFTVEAEVTR